MSIVITGAAGHLGRRTAELVLETADPADVVLVTRTPEALSDFALRGVDVRHGDFDDPATLATAFAGGERLLLISTDAVGRRVQQHADAIDAAQAAGVKLVAYTSILNPSQDNPAGVVPDHRATEEKLRAGATAWTLLRNGLYSEYRVPDAQAAIATGDFHHNLGEGRSAYVAREDCAAAAAAVLTGGDEHAGKTYDITGPELLDASDLAEIFAAVGERPVQAVALDDEAFAAGLAAAGLPPEATPLITSFGAAIREGRLDQLSTAVQDLTGRAPASVRDVVAEAIPVR
ncbi:MAG: NAD(P)-dependent oxidoreductase [Conexibacter sp.]|nr:NAD(P)-dependent oxidoreductase [Conexibacter sp.]